MMIALATMLLLAQGAPPVGELLSARLTEGAWQIWLRDLTTGDDRQITFSPGDKRYPGWTAAGEVYYHTITQECYLVQPSEQAEPEHVAVLRELWPLRDVAWSADGRPAFSRVRTDLIDAANLCTASAGGSPTWLTRDPGIQYNPDWSPDGTRLAFVSGNGWGTYEIESIAADGSDRRKLTENGHHEFLPAWSPDGRSIAFVSDRSGDHEIWVMAADGSQPRRVTDRRGLDTAPCWSPDGSAIAFTSARGGEVQIWSIPAKGGEAVPLLVAPGGARDPAWRASPRVGSPAAGPLVVSEVGVAPKTLRRELDPLVEIRFRLSDAARLRAELVDEDGRVARRLARGRLEPGSHVLAWDGRDDAGAPVPSGVYRYVLVADGGPGRFAVHDPSREPWGEALQPAEFTYDEPTGRLRWIQPRAGFARLRVAVEGFPLLDTLLDWEPLEGGEQVFDWNGLDASGAVQLGSHPGRWIALELFSMPANTILVAGGDGAGARGDWGPPLHRPLVAADERAFFEARKPRRDALAPRLSMEFPSARGTDPEGRPIVKGRVPVRVSIAPEQAASMVDALFEVALYVDLTFFYEDEESTNPVTWVWDTRELAPGPHLLTANVFSYDGRIGCLTRSVLVESTE